MKSFLTSYESHATTQDSTVIDDMREKILLCSLIHPVARSFHVRPQAQSLSIHKQNLLSEEKEKKRCLEANDGLSYSSECLMSSR